MIFFKNSLFGKVFILIFLAISLVLSVFAYQAAKLQKESILNTLYSQAKSMAESISFVNTEAMVVDDEIKILEFAYDFVQVNKNIYKLQISRKDGNTIVIENKKWNLIENDKNNALKINSLEKYKIDYSKDLKMNVFKYTYPIYLSGINWGWLHFDLSLSIYNQKITSMYRQFMYLAIIMLITSLLLSYIIARMVTKPIVKLENISKDISNGDLSKRVKIESSGEIGKLAITFNKMVNNLEISQLRLRKSHNELEDRVTRRTKELKVLNETLALRVKNEISKQKEQEQILIQQSKMAAMGEMIGNIAHQWRQPLNALSLVVQNIKYSYELEELNDEYMQKSIKKVDLLTKTMSKTIDDFRNFFRPNKEKKVFELDDVVKKSIHIIESSFVHYNIEIINNKFENIKVFGFQNEFSQTLLNILNNSKDAHLENKIENAYVKIELNKDNNFGYVIIEDNANGIAKDIIDKIFNPYFTTKEEGKGTGICLYMSKIIIEQNMNGKLEVINKNDGAVFTIKIPIYDENQKVLT